MKILWVNPNFLHPTTKGGQIRTLEMLRVLHRRHEIHYVAMEGAATSAGRARAGEYSTKAYSVPLRAVDKRSPAVALEVARSVFDPKPMSIRRFDSPEMRELLARLAEEENFDRTVCDFLTPAIYFPRIERALLFQHNVETVIWRRRAEHANPALRWYFQGQAEKMFRFERETCLKAGHVVAVSRQDAQTMRELFGVERVTAVPTGVDIEYFNPPYPGPEIETDLAFVGSMDWMPNVDGMLWFVREVLPLIRRKRPDCTVGIIGRRPHGSIAALAREDARIRVTGTVKDIRPYLWRSAVSIVPLRIGGGTRLKIYESMAARVPVVSTSIGAEGLEIHPPEDSRLADSARDFADACLELLADAALRRKQAEAAAAMVAANFSWEHAARCFEQALMTAGSGTARAAVAGA